MRRKKKIGLSTKHGRGLKYGVAIAIVLLAGGSLWYYSTVPVTKPVWCLPFETQDWEQGYCYATCSDQASCVALDDKYKIVQDAYSNDDRIQYYDFSSIPVEIPDGGFAPSTAASYTINEIENGKLGSVVEASSTKRYEGYNERTWQLISYILPRAAAKHITEFAGYADIAGSSGAFVMPADDAAHDWSMNVNYALFYSPRNTLFDRGEIIHTLVHEIGHVMTLADAFEPGTYTADFETSTEDSPIDTFLPAKPSQTSCYTTQFIEGCAKIGSPLALYAARFWPEAKGDGETMATYTPEKFVSSYAATNIAEDMAESWTAFVLLDKPTGNTLADQKVRFFYGYPEFVAARAQILKNINKLH